MHICKIQIPEKSPIQFSASSCTKAPQTHLVFVFVFVFSVFEYFFELIFDFECFFEYFFCYFRASAPFMIFLFQFGFRFVCKIFYIYLWSSWLTQYVPQGHWCLCLTPYLQSSAFPLQRHHSSCCNQCWCKFGQIDYYAIWTNRYTNLKWGIQSRCCSACVLARASQVTSQDPRGSPPPQWGSLFTDDRR